MKTKLFYTVLCTLCYALYFIICSYGKKEIWDQGSKFNGELAYFKLC